MLNALGYGADRPILEETKKILNKFKLFGLILHDPKAHFNFHNTLKNSFERLDFLTGCDFLFFALTDPPRSWKGLFWHLGDRKTIVSNEFVQNK